MVHPGGNHMRDLRLSSARSEDTLDAQVDRVGCIQREDHVSGVGQSEEPRQTVAATLQGLRSFARFGVRATPRAAQMRDGRGDCLSDARCLGHRGGGIVCINTRRLHWSHSNAVSSGRP